MALLSTADLLLQEHIHFHQLGVVELVPIAFEVERHEIAPYRIQVGVAIRVSTWLCSLQRLLLDILVQVVPEVVASPASAGNHRLVRWLHEEAARLVHLGPD
eukprot:3176075-Heterocapsa_arctica.AAC.1